MKKLLSLFAFSCLFVTTIVTTGCSKSNKAASRTSYLQMKLDGILKRYDSCRATSIQQDVGSGTYYQMNFIGGVPGDYGGIYVDDAKPIIEGTYINELNPLTNTPKAGLGAYRPAGTTDIYLSYQNGWPLYDVQIKITSLNKDYVEGVFNGKLRLSGGDKEITVTEGAFKALR